MRAPEERPVRIWHECKREYLAMGEESEILDVSEGPEGQDLVTFTCEHCGETHSHAQVVR